MSKIARFFSACLLLTMSAMGAAAADSVLVPEPGVLELLGLWVAVGIAVRLAKRRK